MSGSGRGDGGSGGGDGGSGGGDGGSGGGKPPRQVADDPLLKPASEIGWDEPSKRAGVEVDPAAPRKPVSRVVDVKPNAPAPTTKPAVPTGTPAATAEAKPEPAAEAKAAEAKPEPAVDTKPAEAKPEPAVEAKPASEAKPEPASEAKPEPATEARPEALAVAPIARPANAHHELRAAVGATPLARKRHTPDGGDDGELVIEDRAPRSLKSIFTIVACIAGVLAIGTFVVLGRVNSENYALACEAERAVPQQGRAFPPWGYHALAGDPWRPLKIVPETRCQARETDDQRILERWFLAMILDEVTAELTAHDPGKLDETDALLKQGLLLTRPPSIPEPENLATERSQQHKDIERMLGDVTFWRAAAKLREAATALSDAAKQFDAAAAQRPRHATDAAAWGGYARKLSDQLRVGPAGGAPPSLNAPSIAAPAPAAPASPAAPAAPDVAAATDTPARPPAPQGTALPVHPDKPHDAEPAPARPEPEPAPPPPTPTAQPTGGVLL